MRFPVMIVIAIAAVWCNLAHASVILPNLQSTSLAPLSHRTFSATDDSIFERNASCQLATYKINRPVAMAIPGYGMTEQIFVGGMLNFLQVYNLVITARVLLSWFPQAQSIGALQPIFAITDPYLNLFRGIIPPIGGLDLSPIAAFFTLNVLSSSTAAIGCEIPEDMKQKFKKSRFGQAAARGVRYMK